MAVGDGIRTIRIDAPVKDDGKPIVCAAPGTRGSFTCISSKLDNLSPAPPASGRAAGSQLLLTFTTTGTQSVTAQFSEPVEIRDANCYWRDTGEGATIPPSAWDFEDMWGFKVKMPASVVTENGTNEGNCDLYNIAEGMNLILPAAGDGTHDINLSTGATPIPDGYTRDSPDNTGYWSVDKYWSGTVSAGTSNQSEFNLYDFDIEMYFVHNKDCGHPLGEWRLDADEAEWLHNTWQLIFWCTKVTSGNGKIGGDLMVFRPGATL